MSPKISHVHSFRSPVYHEAILRKHLERMGTKVEFGSELRTFTQSEDSVFTEIIKHSEGSDAVAVEKTEFSFILGSDGAHSVVRRTLGLDFLGETEESTNMVIGDIKLTSGQREVCVIFSHFSLYINLSVA